MADYIVVAEKDNSVEQGERLMADHFLQDYHRMREELRDLKRQQEQTREELEEAIERANKMAVEAEVANIELKQILNTSIDGVLLISEDFEIQLINRALLAFIGKSEEETAGRKCYDILDDSRCKSSDCPLVRILDGEGHIECDIEQRGREGSSVPFIFTATPFRDLDGGLTGMVAGFKDITERKQAEGVLKRANEQLERLSTIDGLTQVANRRCFDQTIEMEWGRLKRQKQALSLILCDVDFFKLYNDAYGHLAGDECLKSVARALHNTVHRSGDLVTRYGGEEFAVILPATDTRGAVHVAESLRLGVEKLNMAHRDSSVCPHVTISLGVATALPYGSMGPKDLIAGADGALYDAKGCGRNRVAVRYVQ